MRYAPWIPGTHRGPMSAIAHNCASCGHGTAAAGPVTWSTSERHYFGIVPAKSLIRAGHTRLARFLAIVRSTINYAAAVVVSRSGAAVDEFRLRREHSRLRRERTRQIQALGEAVYRNDLEETARIRSGVDELERRMEATRTEQQRIRRRAEEQIARARMETGPTNVVEPEPVPEPVPEPSEPPGPVIVPEPEPVPHEPPGPVIVPEPEPPRE